MLRVVLLAFSPVFWWFAVAAQAEDVTNTTNGRTYADLQQALDAAAPGDTLELAPGTYKGNFVINTPLSLTGTGPERPVLDASGTGSALTIHADNVTVSFVALSNSGHDSTMWSFWGDAGLFVAANDVRLSDLSVTGNDWGVILKTVDGAVIENSTIADNARDGIAILGGTHASVSGNMLSGNEVGLSITAYFGEDRESPLAQIGTPEAAQRLAELKSIAVLSQAIEVTGNEVTGNAAYGIAIDWESFDVSVTGNTVTRTGIDRSVDQSRIDFMLHSVSQSFGADIPMDREPYGTGILVNCLSHDNLVADNTIHDNFAFGIGLVLVNHNEIRTNAVADNRIGLAVESSNDNRIAENTISGNADFGIRVAVSYLISSPSSNNLLVLNDLSGSPTLAFDNSGRRLTVKDLIPIIDTIAWPDEVKAQMKASKQLQQVMLQSFVDQLKPASNNWDDGSFGNHYEDFDEPSEGFRDKNGDGIGEKPRAIAGGSSLDHFPLTEDKLAGLRDAG